MKNMLLIGLGFFLLALGGIGVFLPVLPTTPFVLAAAGCFSGSPRIHSWLCRCSYFKEYIEHYRSGQGISRKTKTRSLFFLWAMLALSASLARTWLVCGILLAVGIGVTIHICMMTADRSKKTFPKD